MITWQEFVARVDAVVDAMGLEHDEVNIRYIDILGSEGFSVEVLRQPDGRYDMFVE